MINLAVILHHFYSKSLTEANSMQVIVPLETSAKEKFPVLWLLPPMGYDHSAWIRKTNIEKLAEELEIIIAMPDMKLSCGLNMVHGFTYYDMLTDELIEKVNDVYPTDSSCHIIAGAKEGGYAALKAALSKPKNYKMAISLSCGSLTDVIPSDCNEKEYANAFGTKNLSELQNTEFDLKFLAETASSDIPPIALYYSDEDDFRNSAVLLDKKLKQLMDDSLNVSKINHKMDWCDWTDSLNTSLSAFLSKKCN